MGRGPSNGRGDKLNKGAWTALEDKILKDYVTAHGDRRWHIVAREAGLSRSAKSSRLRWLNYLRPDIKRGNITKDEEDLIIRLHKLLGNRWSLIAGRLPGRTDNEIKNYWNTNLIKKLEKASHTNNRRVNDQTKTKIETFETEKPSALLQHDIAKLQFLNDDICLDPARSGGRESLLDHNNSGYCCSAATTLVEVSGQLKMDFLVDDVDRSITNLEYEFSRLRDYDACLTGSASNACSEDFLGQSFQWLPEGFLDNRSWEFASGEDWVI
ncbi:transcription factor WER-like isoform X2 [Punica granatum]|uniref:Uncharacterized protein n=2 Tax=Punica granatum TaxID=22663 RepID=A0A218XHA8_PUNGR|nr:transcription factor WER-like isoform X2 [Punica granatum]OWM84116.1 hypothetical protein CDL15_Pgr009363 [Punica granatum]PKI79017.1 hypothetical protein CRG98_000590 [Punica granatum]